MSYSFLKRCACISALATLATGAFAQEPSPSAPGTPAGEPQRPLAQAQAPAGAGRVQTRQRSGVPAQMNSPHAPKIPEPRVAPAPDLPKGEIEVRLAPKGLQDIGNQEVTLAVSKQSIERGNIDTTLTARTDMRGVARFPAQPTETDHIYSVTVAVDEARYSTEQFQFRASDLGGMRVIMPIFKGTKDLEGLLVLSRTMIAIVPQDDLFAIDVLWRIENFSEVSWLPENVFFQLPEGFEALTIRDPKANARFERADDQGVKLAGTFAPGQHDLLLRFHLPTEGKSERSFSFPTTLNVGMVRVLMDSAPTMDLKVEGFPNPEETRNASGQRRLTVGRDFLSEKMRAPEKVEIKISGIPTPAAGRTVAVGIAAAIALAGISQTLGRRRKVHPTRSNLSKEDRERASELLLEELINLEQAFKQGTIGRKTHEQARRQLLEAFARLGAERDPEDAPKPTKRVVEVDG